MQAKKTVGMGSQKHNNNVTMKMESRRSDAFLLNRERQLENLVTGLSCYLLADEGDLATITAFL